MRLVSRCTDVLSWACRSSAVTDLKCIRFLTLCFESSACDVIHYQPLSVHHVLVDEFAVTGSRAPRHTYNRSMMRRSTRTSEELRPAVICINDWPSRAITHAAGVEHGVRISWIRARCSNSKHITAIWGLLVPSAHRISPLLSRPSNPLMGPYGP